MREKKSIDGFPALLSSALLVGSFSIASTALAMKITQPPSAFEITTDGKFTDPNEWSDVMPAVRIGGESLVYTSTDPGLDALYLMYDLPSSTTSVPTKEITGPVHFHNSGSSFEVFFSCPDEIIVLKDGIPFDVSDPAGGEDSIQGACGFGPSPGHAIPHNMFELEVLFDGSDVTLSGHNHGQYSPDPSHWGAGLPTDPNQLEPRDEPRCEEPADPSCDPNNDPTGGGEPRPVPCPVEGPDPKVRISFGDEVSNACVHVVRGSGGNVLITPIRLPGEEPAALDHFMFYKVKERDPKFVKFGPLVLTDQFREAKYDIKKPKQLGLPALKLIQDSFGSDIDTVISDPNTHLKEYQIKRSKGTPKFTPILGVRVVNQCNDLLIDVTKVKSLLVPTNKRLTGPVGAPATDDHNLDHFLCYQAKSQEKLPKGLQVDVTDQFQSRRYDLKKITKLCNPVAKRSDPNDPPIFLSGDDKGLSLIDSIFGSDVDVAIRNPNDHLVCYKAKQAKKFIDQDGCGPADPEDKGTKISPKQVKHTPVVGLFVNNQFGPEELDTKKEVEFCIPSLKTAP